MQPRVKINGFDLTDTVGIELEQPAWFVGLGGSAPSVPAAVTRYTHPLVNGNRLVNRPLVKSPAYWTINLHFYPEDVPTGVDARSVLMKIRSLFTNPDNVEVAWYPGVDTDSLVNNATLQYTNTGRLLPQGVVFHSESDGSHLIQIPLEFRDPLWRTPWQKMDIELDEEDSYTIPWTQKIEQEGEWIIHVMCEDVSPSNPISIVVNGTEVVSTDVETTAAYISQHGMSVVDVSTSELDSLIGGGDLAIWSLLSDISPQPVVRPSLDSPLIVIEADVEPLEPAGKSVTLYYRRTMV